MDERKRRNAVSGTVLRAERTYVAVREPDTGVVVLKGDGEESRRR
jgi:hypothetical protein